MVVPNFNNGDWFYINGVGDFNGDDHLDLIILSYKLGYIFASMGDGNGSFREPIALSIEARMVILSSMITADVNGDGRLDLTFIGNFGFDIVVMFGDDSGTFGAGGPIQNDGMFYIGIYGSNSHQLETITTGDLNGDHHLDIVATSWSWCSINILVGHGDGTFATSSRIWSGEYWCSVFVVLGDFNRDNLLDIAFTHSEKAQGGVLLGHGNGTFSASAPFFTGNHSFPTGMIVHDFNNDGCLDIAVANRGGYNIGVLLGKGDGTFYAQMTFSAGGLAPHSLVIGDFNGDGQLDLSYAGYWSANVGVLFGYGNGSFGAQMTFSNTDPRSGFWLFTGDLNNDNRLDLVIKGSSTPLVLWNTCECCASQFFNTSNPIQQ